MLNDSLQKPLGSSLLPKAHKCIMASSLRHTISSSLKPPPSALTSSSGRLRLLSPVLAGDAGRLAVLIRNGVANSGILAISVQEPLFVAFPAPLFGRSAWLGKSRSSHTLALSFGSVLGRRAAAILVGMWDAVPAHAVVVLVRGSLAAHFAVWVLLKCGFRFSGYRICDCKYFRSS
jgi:hypothetical protein